MDVGVLAMEAVPKESVEDKIRFATDIYVDHWKGKLHSFFLHSKITTIHASKKPERQRKDTLEYYLGVARGEKKPFSQSYCRICAQKGPLFESGRDNYPLVGSGEFVNFHHFHETGLLICKDCLVRIYFAPLGVLEAGGNLIVLQLQSDYMRELWREEVIQKNLDKASRGSSEGLLKSNLLRAQNALFHFAGRLIDKFENQPSQQIRLFYFSNFGSTPDVAIHDLPNRIFLFLKRVLKSDFRKDWQYFIKKHFRIKKAQFDETAQEWFETKKKHTRTLDGEEYVGTHYNVIYDSLLAERSILRYLCQTHKVKSFPILISISYLKEVRQMKQEQIDLIRQISNKIIGLSEKGGDFKKFITPIEGARYAHELRTAILRMVKAHYKNGEPEPFVRFNDYVEYLFPDGQSWFEVRDFMLICLYEKLHELRIEPEKITDESIADVEESEHHLESFNV